ncbi:MAG: exosortase/archaeosortase family protein [Flavobacteriales bacterium]|nr:exosortase/archaeosortase family protein [Flavobacteriales bacterium]
MSLKFRENPLLRFLVFGTSAYIFWYILYEFILRGKTHFDECIVDNIVRGVEIFLSFLGYSLIAYNDPVWKTHVGIQDSLGVTVGAPCDGIVLFALFAIFIFAFPGPIKHKAWFIPAGIIAIHVLNILRVAALAIIVDINPSWLDFNHDYTFTIIVYGAVIGLWYLWIQKFSPLKKVSNA